MYISCIYILISYHKGAQCAVVSRLDFCAGDPGSIQAGAEFPTGICSG